MREVKEQTWDTQIAVNKFKRSTEKVKPVGYPTGSLYLIEKIDDVSIYCN
jgi:hypothetical protein